MTYPKITLKPKSWDEDSTIELDYEEAKSIYEQLKVVFEYPTQIVSVWESKLPKMESITKTSQPCMWDLMPETYPRSGIKIGGVVCTCPKCSPVNCEIKLL